MDAAARECLVMFRLARIFSHPSFRPDKIKNEKRSRFLFAKRKMKMGKTKNKHNNKKCYLFIISRFDHPTNPHL